MKAELIILIFICLLNAEGMLYTMPIVSGSGTFVYGTSTPYGGNSVECYNGFPTWTPSSQFLGAQWIWDSYYVTNPDQDEYCHFLHEFFVPGKVASASLKIASDNQLWLQINNNNFGEIPDSYSSPLSLNVTDYVQTGKNVLNAMVKNLGSGGGPTINPAGLIYCLVVSYNL